MVFKNSQEKMAFELAAGMDAEQQLLQGMQQFRQIASNPQLQQLLDRHIEQTQQQIQQLQQAAGMLGGQQQATCQAARGLVADGQMIVEQCALPEMRDCAIGASWLKAEHFEMACYRGMMMAAQALGQQELQQTIQQILQQEEQTAQQIEQAMPQILQQSLQAETAMA
ncbi:MAG TPA: DUF892 family protein [Thermomicrobiales bacterium]|jgi:ferritin-like metal-binding protein YciE